MNDKKPDIEKLDGSAQEQYVKLLVNTMYDLQKPRVGMGNRIAAFKKAHGDQYGELVTDLEDRLWKMAHDMENKLERDLGKAVAKVPIIRWLEQVKGIGPRLSGALVGKMAPIERWRTVSALWSYVGYSVILGCQNCVAIFLEGKDRRRFLDRQVERRWDVHITSKQYLARLESIGDDPKLIEAFVYGERIPFIEKAYTDSEEKLCHCDNQDIKSVAPDRKYYGGLILPYNTFMKDTCWRIGSQFVKQGDYYRDWYERYKESYALRRPDMSIGRNDNSARRATVKLFLSHFWEMWRKSQGLPAGMTYLQERLGVEYAERHTYIAPPFADTFDAK